MKTLTLITIRTTVAGHYVIVHELDQTPRKLGPVDSYDVALAVKNTLLRARA